MKMMIKKVRSWRREYWCRRYFNSLDKLTQRAFREMKIDPDSLKKKGKF